MKIHTDTITRTDSYKLLSGCIVPRPVAWVTSTNQNGLINLAPFSVLTYLSTDPPMIGFGIGLKQGTDEQKDTERNVRLQKEFVVHIASSDQIDLVQRSGFPFPSTISEVVELKLAVTDSDVVSVPRLLSSKISMECRLHDIINFGRDGSKLVVGEIVMFHIDDNIYRDGKIDSFELNPVVRVAGMNYATLGNKVSYEK